MSKNLGTESYKGTRDFYPEDMAIQRYIFDTWSRTAELFGFERYDASVLEPAELYRNKTSEEIVNEQTYTFTDRGDREVTLRPEMTPTVARMIAGRRRELSFPVRWYSIPNLFRYERPQRGRLREHWQLNCDIFGESHYAADVEIIKLAYDVLIAFGADESMFKIRINDRALMSKWYETVLHLDEPAIKAVSRIVDRKDKMPETDFKEALGEILDSMQISMLITALETEDPTTLHAEAGITKIIAGLNELGVTNVHFDASLARGFDYYTGTIFEIFDASSENNRSLIGGGRYNNLTTLFGGDPIPGIGFGMGDVTMRDFLETHDLLTANITAPTVVIIPTDTALNIEGEKIAQTFRNAGISVTVDTSDRKVGKKISAANEAFVQYVLVFGDDELSKATYTLKSLHEEKEERGTLKELVRNIS